MLERMLDLLCECWSETTVQPQPTVSGLAAIDRSGISITAVGAAVGLEGMRRWKLLVLVVVVVAAGFSLVLFNLTGNVPLRRQSLAVDLRARARQRDHAVVPTFATSTDADARKAQKETGDAEHAAWATALGADEDTPEEHIAKLERLKAEAVAKEDYELAASLKQIERREAGGQPVKPVESGEEAELEALRQTSETNSTLLLPSAAKHKAELEALQQASDTDSTQLPSAAKQQDPHDKSPSAQTNCLHRNRRCLCSKRARWRSYHSQVPIRVIGVYFVGWELSSENEKGNQVTGSLSATVDVIVSQLDSIKKSPLVGCCGTVAPYALHLMIVVSSTSVEKMKSLIPSELLGRVELVPYTRTDEGGLKGTTNWDTEHDKGVFEGVALNALRGRCIKEETAGHHTTLAFYVHAKRSCRKTGWRQYLEHYIFKDPEPCVHSLLNGNGMLTLAQNADSYMSVSRHLWC